MAAPKNNDFWKFRSKHGRDKLFESPELLWEEACKYFQWIKDNPLKEYFIYPDYLKEDDVIMDIKNYLMEKLNS